MRRYSVLIALGLAIVIAACGDSTRPTQPVSETIQFHGISFLPDSTAVELRQRDPGLYLLKISMHDKEGGLIQFSVQGATEDPSELLTVGDHPATGDVGDYITVNLADKGTFDFVNFPGLISRQMSIVWQTASVGDQSFSGRGYIHLKQRIDYACADSFNTAYGTLYPGDPGYDHYYEMMCEPGFYFPAQKIGFSFEGGLVW